MVRVVSTGSSVHSTGIRKVKIHYSSPARIKVYSKLTHPPFLLNNTLYVMMVKHSKQEF